MSDSKAADGKPPRDASPTLKLPEKAPQNPERWKRVDVKDFIILNKDEYDLDDKDINLIFERHVTGRSFPILTREELVSYGLTPGGADVFMSLINALIKPQSVAAEEDLPHPRKIRRLGDEEGAYRCWAWWQSVRELRFGDTSTLNFPVDILGWKVFGSKILVRDSYKHIYNVITWDKLSGTVVSGGTANDLSYIVTGTPGIGKSFFGFYLIYRYAHEFPESNIQWENGDIRVIFLADGGIQYQLSGSRSVTSINRHGEGEYIFDFTHCKTFYIADAIRPTGGNARRYVLVTSPQEKRYKELAKASGVQMLGMPIWDEAELEELRKLRFPSVTESDLNEYFDKWGGVPRSVLERIDSNYQQYLEDICSTVDINACMRFIGTLRYNSTTVSGTVLHMSVTKEGRYQDRRVRFASIYIENIVLSLYEKGVKEHIIQYIRETEGNNALASMRGFLFEAVAHRILMRGGVFEIRRLGHSTKEELTFPTIALQIFRTVDEIKPGFYSRPHSTTFESIDALRTGQGEYDELFQMTVGTQHGIKVNGLQNIAGKLTKKVRLYFVVPNDVYPKFINPQNYLNLQGQKHQKIPQWINDVEQWVLKLDYTTF